MLIFGGRSASGRVNDLWILDGTNGRWFEPQVSGCPPSPRSFHSCVALGGAIGAPVAASAEPSALSFGVAAAIFGGLDTASHHLNDLHLLHGAGVWAWVCVRQAGGLPSPRGCAVAASIPMTSGGPSSKVLVFGGSSDWADERGGSTAYHGDGGALDLAPCLSALARAVGGELPPTEEAGTVEAAICGTAAIDAAPETLPDSPPHAQEASQEGGRAVAALEMQAADQGHDESSCGGVKRAAPSPATLGISKRKKAVPTKKTAALVE